MKLALRLLALLGPSIACQTSAPDGSPLLSEPSGLEEVSIVSKGLE